MVQNPEIGGQYWFVTDIWERFCPVPVTIVAVWICGKGGELS